ncbi:MAG TPA: DUF2779 domain-containing protein, partial [Polyangiales bacterium]|nr:DUF2779 domain-containing protein [Polyangiales bacterium]
LGEGFALLEVKSTVDAKAKHLPDLAIQTYVARRAGLRIDRIEVMHLNRGHRHPDVEPLFVRSDVTESVNALVAQVPAEIARQLAMLGRAQPEVAVGDHCHKPYTCPFESRCWPAPRLHDVAELYRMSSKAADLRALGYDSIADVPDDAQLNAIAARQRKAVLRGETVVEPGLQQVLDTLVQPLSFLDFEAVNAALPIWNGCAPYQSVPVQHSVHRAMADGSTTHAAFLAEGPSDPRARLAEDLLQATAGAGSVLVWHAEFERKCILELADLLPARAAELHALADRLVDLLPIVRNHVYHPEFRGSFSLKDVGPALVPELAYDDLAITDGNTAAVTLLAWLVNGSECSAEQRARTRAELLAYCERDTLLLVHILERLRALSQACP